MTVVPLSNVNQLLHQVDATILHPGLVVLTVSALGSAAQGGHFLQSVVFTWSITLGWG